MNDILYVDIKKPRKSKNANLISMKFLNCSLLILKTRVDYIKNFIDITEYTIELLESKFQSTKCKFKREDHQYRIDDLNEILNLAYKIDELNEYLKENFNKFFILRYYCFGVKLEKPMMRLRECKKYEYENLIIRLENMKKELIRLIDVAIENIALHKKLKQREADKRYSIKRKDKYTKRKKRKDEYFECFKKGLSIKEIAIRLKVTEQAVYSFVKRNNIDISKYLGRY